MALHWSLLLVIVSGALGASLRKSDYDEDLGLSLVSAGYLLFFWTPETYPSKNDENFFPD